MAKLPLVGGKEDRSGGCQGGVRCHCLMSVHSGGRQGHLMRLHRGEAVCLKGRQVLKVVLRFLDSAQDG